MDRSSPDGTGLPAAVVKLPACVQKHVGTRLTDTLVLLAARVKLRAGVQEYVAIRLIDTHDHILSALDRALSAYATQQFQRSGIELVLGCRVSAQRRFAN